MSFRELRNFTEMMRALGYPRPISVDNFRTPNFALVADILYWLVQRYDPLINIPDNIDTEDDRVKFLNSVEQVMASKARISLRAKSLYAADGRAVKEMLKIASMLYSARKLNRKTMPQREEEQKSENIPTHFLDQLLENGGPRAIAAEITDLGAKLHDLLKNENQIRDARQKALRFLDAVSGNLDARAEHNHLEQSIRDAINTTKQQVEALKAQVQELETDEKSIKAKLTKRQADVERNEKRLASLQTVRPAFMDEYERLERELAEEYDVYMQRYRNLDYLEHELDVINKREQAKAEATQRSLKRLQRNLRQKEIEVFRGNEYMDTHDKYSSSDESASDTESTDGNVSESSGTITPQPRAREHPSNEISERDQGRPSTSRGRGRPRNVRGRMDYSGDSESSDEDEGTDLTSDEGSQGSFDDSELDDDATESEISDTSEENSDYDM